jgi:hypothetical protein
VSAIYGVSLTSSKFRRSSFTLASKHRSESMRITPVSRYGERQDVVLGLSDVAPFAPRNVCSPRPGSGPGFWSQLQQGYANRTCTPSKIILAEIGGLAGVRSFAKTGTTG